MGFFDQSTGIEDDVEKVTCEKNTSDNWSGIMDVCDKVNMDPTIGKHCLRAIMKRMGHSDPHVAMQAITLLNACVNNCGEKFHLEVASREFEKEFKTLLNKAQGAVASKMRQVLKSWAEGEFKTAPELNLIPTLYEKLRLEGHDFSSANEKTKINLKSLTTIKDPNVVTSQQEEDDLAKAIELSLKEVKHSPKRQIPFENVGSSSGANASTSSYPSLYPTFGSTGTVDPGASVGNATSEPRKVRALYDFEAAEENELTFIAGEIIHVTDDSDPNWWKGFNQRGDGLFPANFVTSDLSVETELSDAKGMVQEEKAGVTDTSNIMPTLEINESKIDRLMHLLHEANPEDSSQDTEEMLRLEQEVHQMGPLIDAELEHVDRKHAQLSQLSCDLVDAINMYHSLMKNDRSSLGSSYMMSAMSVGLGANLPGMVNTYQHINPQHQPIDLYGNSVRSNFGTINSMPYNPPRHQILLQNSVDTAAMPVSYPNCQINAMHPQQGQSAFTTNMQLNQQQQQVAPMNTVMPGSLPTSQVNIRHQAYPNNVQIPTSGNYPTTTLINPNATQADLQQQQQQSQLQSVHQASAPTANYQTIMDVTSQRQEQIPYSNNNNVTGANIQGAINGATQINVQQLQQKPANTIATAQYISPQHQTVNPSYHVQYPSAITNNNDIIHAQTFAQQFNHPQYGHLDQTTSMNLNNSLHSNTGAIQPPPPPQQLQTTNSSVYTQNITQNTPIYQQQR